MKRFFIPSAIVAATVHLACGGPAPAQAPTPPEPTAAEPAAAEPTAAEPSEAPPAEAKSVDVVMEAKSGSTLKGSATLTEVDGGVKVVLSVQGVSPGKHGAHVHETGDCSSPDGKSAGGHFNPASHDHALPPTAVRHLGDLGNIEVGEDGSGKTEIVIPGANLKPGEDSSFLGRSIIVHEKVDDGGQPVGNAGGRIGCGVIPST